MYWDFYELVKSMYPASWALGCRDLPAELGGGPSYLFVQWEGGTVASTRIIGPDDPLEATFVLGMDYADWKVLLEDGDLLEFFKAIYFFAECLAVIGTVPADYPEVKEAQPTAAG